MLDIRLHQFLMLLFVIAAQYQQTSPVWQAVRLAKLVPKLTIQFKPHESTAPRLISRRPPNLSPRFPLIDWPIAYVHKSAALAHPSVDFERPSSC